MPLKRAMAAYVRTLEDCLANTHRAEDRSIYEKYLRMRRAFWLLALPLSRMLCGESKRMKDSGATHGSKTRYTAKRNRPGTPSKNTLTTFPPSLELCAGGFSYDTKKGQVGRRFSVRGTSVGRSKKHAKGGDHRRCDLRYRPSRGVRPKRTVLGKFNRTTERQSKGG